MIMTSKINHPSEMIRKQMLDAGMTVSDLAFLLDKKYTTVYAVVRNNNSLTVEFAQKCAAIFNVDPEIYLNKQNLCELEEQPLDPEFKNSLKLRFKELKKIKTTKNKRGAGRKWTN